MDTINFPLLALSRRTPARLCAAGIGGKPVTRRQFGSYTSDSCRYRRVADTSSTGRWDWQAKWLADGRLRVLRKRGLYLRLRR